MFSHSSLADGAISAVLTDVYTLVTQVGEAMEFCKDDDADVIPDLVLEEAKPKADDIFMRQFCDLLGYERFPPKCDVGQVTMIGKYIPVDLTQIPVKVSSRVEALQAIRMCERLCNLIENQSHCIKNSQLMIINLIQYVFTQVALWT